MENIFVLDSEDKTSLAIIRSLGKRNLKITAGAYSKLLPSTLSKYKSHIYKYSNPNNNYFRFLNDLKKGIEKYNISAIFPAIDSTSVILSKYKSDFEELGVLVGVENWERFIKTYDKRKTFEIAEKVNVPYPKTHSINSEDQIKEISEELSYPVVIKPRSKSYWDKLGNLHMIKIKSINYAFSPVELVKKFQKLLKQNVYLRDKLPLIQTYINGKIFDTVILAKQGKLIAYFQNKRIRTFPKEGGAFTLAKSIKPNQKMLKYTKALVEELEWTGPAMIEFIKSKDDGEFYLMEINGRYWGSLPLTILSGVNIPWLHYLLLKNKKIGVQKGLYKEDLKLRWLLPGDILWLLDNLRSGKFKAILPFLKSFLHSKYAIISLKDPLPTIGALIHMVKLLIKVITGKRSFSGEKR